MSELQTSSSVSKTILRFLICLLVFILPLKFGSPLGNGEIINFPMDIWEWIFFTCIPAYLAPVFCGTVAILTAVICKPGKLTSTVALPLLWLCPLLAGLAGLINTTETDYAQQWIWHFAGALALTSAVWRASSEDEKLLPWIMTTIALAGIISALHGWYQHLWGLEEARTLAIENARQTGIPLSQIMQDKLLQTRIYGTAADPNVYSAHLLFCLPFSLVKLYQWGSRFEKPAVGSTVLTLLGLLLFGCAFFWAGSRGAAIGAAAGIAIVFWSHPKIRKWRFKWLIPAMAILLAVLLAAAMSLGKSRGGTATASVRLTYYNAAVKIFLEHPVAGAGLGEFFTNYLRLKPMGAEVTREPHNMFLALLCQCGIWGGLAFLLLYFFPWFAATRTEPPPARRAAFTAALAASAAWLTHSLFQFNELIPGTLYPLCLGGFFLITPTALNSKNYRDIYARCLIIITALAACVPAMRMPGEINLQRAEKLEQAGFGPQISIYKQCTEQLPHSSLPWKCLYERAMSRGDFKEAITAAEAIAARSPRRASSHLRLAKAQFFAGQFSEAETSLKEADVWYPWYSDAMVLKAVIRYCKNNPPTVPEKLMLLNELGSNSSALVTEDSCIAVTYTSQPLMRFLEGAAPEHPLPSEKPLKFLYLDKANQEQ